MTMRRARFCIFILGFLTIFYFLFVGFQRTHIATEVELLSSLETQDYIHIDIGSLFDRSSPATNDTMSPLSILNNWTSVSNNQSDDSVILPGSDHKHKLEIYSQFLSSVWPQHHLSRRRDVMKHSSSSSMSECLLLTASLGPVFVPTHLEHLKGHVLTRYSRPYVGGFWSPSSCRARLRVALLIPYRRRKTNLQIFLHHMHFFLQQQLLDYGIFVLEQVDTKRFNRAKLFNIGYLFALQMHDYDCFVLHDVDKIPEDTRFLYHCSKEHPKQMPHLFRQANLSPEDITTKRRYTSAHVYKDYFGGVTALTRDQYLTINGMTNEYWGWGGEDDELICRVRAQNLQPIFSQEDSARYVMIAHRPDAQYSQRPFPDCKKVSRYMFRDGLNTLAFNLKSISFQPLYTHIQVAL